MRLHLAQAVIRSALQRIIVAFVQAVNFVAIEPLVAYLEPRAQHTDCGNVFHGEPNGLRRCREATITDTWSQGPLTLCGKQLGR